MSIDLTFEDLSARAVQYNARASVEDFDACMAEYAALAQRAKAQTPGIYDLRYGMSAAERLDLFPACTQPAPLLIFIHGGYWHSQRKEEACSMAATFARRGVAVATLEYTLAPEATLAEIVHEVRSAVAWLYHHGAPFGIDPARIFVSGSSAGGHLCGMLIADGWQPRYRLPPKRDQRRAGAEWPLRSAPAVRYLHQRLAAPDARAGANPQPAVFTAGEGTCAADIARRRPAGNPRV